MLSPESDSESPVRRRLAPEERKAQLLEEAAELFTRYGSSFTSSQLAASAGVSEGTVFRYFPDMSSLMRAARRKAIGITKLVPLLHDAANLPDLRDRLIAAGRALTVRIVQTRRLLEASTDLRDRPKQEEMEVVIDALAPLFHDSNVGDLNSRQQASLFLGLLVSSTFFTDAEGADSEEDRAGWSDSPGAKARTDQVAPVGQADPTGHRIGVEDIVDIFLDGLLARSRS